jgi:1-acyl-sn-glycerol-3-phosphate acyltransferase
LKAVKGSWGVLRLVYRLPWFALHVLVGTPIAVLCQAGSLKSIRLGHRYLGEVMLTWWSGMICRIFGLDRRIRGTIGPGPQLLAANHISWIDIPLLHSVAAMGFVAKAEIEEWPVIGWLGRIGDTVYHRRGSHDSASGVVNAMAERLAAGGRVAIFPEGGILPGVGVKRFHARMFGAAINTGVPVQPAMLRYSRDGNRQDDITFRQNEHFLANFFRLMQQPKCTAEIELLPPIPSLDKRRRQLAEDAEAAVRAAFEAELPRD